MTTAGDFDPVSRVGVLVYGGQAPSAAAEPPVEGFISVHASRTGFDRDNELARGNKLGRASSRIFAIAESSSRSPCAHRGTGI